MPVALQRESAQCVLLSSAVADMHNNLLKADTAILLGILSGHDVTTVAAVYNTTQTSVLRTSYEILQDLGRQYGHGLPALNFSPFATADNLRATARHLIEQLSARSVSVVSIFDLLSQREQEECLAVLPLFDVFARMSNRLKELQNHGNIQTHPRT